MKVRKNFEAIFVVAAVLATVATYASARVPAQAVAAPVAVKAVASEQKMQVVVIKGHRLTAAEKAKQV
jgi:predicted cation transporter